MKAATKKKSSAPAVIFLSICIALTCVFIVYLAATTFFVTPEPVSTPAPSPVPVAQSAEPTEPEASPEPVDLRSYDLDYPVTDSKLLDASIQSVVDGIVARFDGEVSPDTEETLVLRSEYYEANDVMNLCMNVSYADTDYRVTKNFDVYSGDNITSEKLLGEQYREYVNDYLVNKLFKSKDYADKLADDYESNIADDPANFNTYLMHGDGSATFYIAPGLVTVGADVLEINVSTEILSGNYYNRHRIDPDKPMVALTFDDGPSGDYTPRILDALEANGAVATFFEIGKNVKEYPEIVKRASDMGCEIGSHSYQHYKLAFSGKDAMLADKAKCDEVFTAAIGYVPTLFRPPEGEVSGEYKKTYDQIFIGWSVDTLDWLYKNAYTTVDTVKSFGNLDGQVILMHSIYSASADAAEQLIPWLIEKGYQLVTVSELFEYHYGIDPEQHVYYAYDYFVSNGEIGAY